MSLDGIRVIKKKIVVARGHKDHNFWAVDAINPNTFRAKTLKSVRKPFVWREFWQELRTHFFNRKIALSLVAAVLIIAITSISVSSYNFFRKNYDFIKLFKSGKYLILLQNNTEMRATGGFIGSFATVEFEGGVFKNYQFDSNIYKRDNTFSETHSIEPPDEALTNFIGGNKWAMRDSNWAVDYPTAAKQVAWFYEQEGGKPVDGVVALNATVLQDILSITGPIEMPEYNVTVTHDNFIETSQYKIEREYFANPLNKIANEPKSFLADLTPKIISKLSQNGKYKLVTDLIYQELRDKQILFYFYDDNKEKIALENGWGGEVKDHSGDYLYVNNSNLAGNKSSLNVKEDIKLNTSISNDGSAINTLTLTRTHSGDGVWPDGENVNYVRILVPYGSELISAKLDGVGCGNDVKIKKEAGKSVFALWVNTLPRSSRILTITYKLPDVISKNNYSLYVQKQPGNLGDDLQVVFDGTVKFNGILDTNKDIK